MSEDKMGFWRGPLAAMLAIFVGIGLARFAYGPLLPALVREGWFEAADAAYLGAANLAGYLAGALLAPALAARIRPALALRILMLGATATFFACALPLGFAWFFLWRFFSGLVGGGIMGIAAPTVLAHVPVERRGIAGGVIFAGVGLGIIASGSLVPALLAFDLGATWAGLGALTLLLTLLAWRGWPEADPPLPPLAGHAPATWSLRRLYLLYGLNAAGLVPHMVFLVDFVARGLDRGLETGSAYWVVFGMGATIGPVLAGAMGDRLGFTRALPLALLLQAGAIALPLLSTGTLSLVVSSLVVGTFVPGIVPLVLGRMQDFVPPDPATRRKAWSLATAAFAVGQAAAAYGLSYAFAQGAGYEPIFAWGAGALVAALGVEVAGRLIGAPRSARGA